ncbi:MAG: NB-ARC domain-containing protein, partial [Candidatus Hodarchaeota archaeon]
SKTAPYALSIIGLGGIGKTSLALEVVNRIKDMNLFHRVLWCTCKKDILIGRDIVRIKNTINYSEGIIRDLCRQLHYSDWQTSDLSRIQVYLKSVLKSNRKRFLILLDNFETINDPGHTIHFFLECLNPSKLLITSRDDHFLCQTQQHKIKGLSEIDSYNFLKDCAQLYKVPTILRANKSMLYNIHKSTGGQPLAMRLIVGQAGKIPLDKILITLKKVKGEDIYPFIYYESWQQLELTSKKLLLQFETTPDTLYYDELETVANSDCKNDESFTQSLTRLVELQLIDPVDERGEEYQIHELTRNFILSDLPRIWKNKGLLK